MARARRQVSDTEACKCTRSGTAHPGPPPAVVQSRGLMTPSVIVAITVCSDLGEEMSLHTVATPESGCKGAQITSGRSQLRQVLATVL